MAAIIINVIILVLGLLNFILTVMKRKAGAFAFYTQDSNYCALAAAVVYLLALRFPALSGAAIVLRYTASCMLGLTFFVVMAVLIPMGAGVKAMLWHAGFLVHVAVPGLSILTTLFLDPVPDGRFLFLPPIITLVYGIIMMVLNYLGKYDGPYPFFWVRRQSRLATVLWTCVLFAAILGISFLIMKGAAALQPA